MINLPNWKKVLNDLEATHTQLIAVSKTKPASDIQALYDAGQRVFGENKVQEMTEKYEQLPQDIEWHLIGHLQSNKVKYIAPFVHLIHSVDSLKLLQEIQKQAQKANRRIDVLLQMFIAQEETKFGLDETEAKALLDVYTVQPEHFANVRIVGLMGMATNTDDEAQIRQEFRALKTLFGQLQSIYFADEPSFKEISMGMSSDYQLAAEEGSTMVRVGSLLFGNR
jgi:pyridoxal phosphate enzyme (YggS family)